MIVAYEDPEKTRMRSGVEVAIDQAGFELILEPERISLPEGSKLMGSLVGDLQSVDGNGVRTFYYIRPGRDLAVPKWIANLARASHASNSGRVYIVVNDYTPELIVSCNESGCGLLKLTDDALFEIVVDYSNTSPRTLEDAFEARITRMRRTMEHKIDLVRTDIEARYSSSAALLSNMDSDAADRYKDGFESEFRSIDSWGNYISRRLDALGPSSELAEVKEVDSLINTGPPKADESVQ